MSDDDDTGHPHKIRKALTDAVRWAWANKWPYLLGCVVGAIVTKLLG